MFVSSSHFLFEKNKNAKYVYKVSSSHKGQELAPNFLALGLTFSYLVNVFKPFLHKVCEPETDTFLECAPMHDAPI